MSILQQRYWSETSRRDFLHYLRIRFVDALKEDIRPLDISRKTNFFDENHCFSLWEVQFTDWKIALLEIRQRSKNDPRITLTRDAFKVMEDLGVHNALIVFYSQDSSSWRFSLLTLKKSWWEKEFSDPKRYSFLLGVGEKIKTPEKYLKKQIVSFEDLLSRFNVEVVRKEFFNHYLTLYTRLYKAIQDDSEFVNLLKRQWVDGVSFTKNLLWKIVFLYFIQKKWWLWVERDKEFWKDGDKNFMRTIWNDFQKNNESLTKEKTGYFYNDYLEWLFYDGLNKDRRDSDDYFPNLKMRVPYLNGWLFQEDYKYWDTNISKISNSIFSNSENDGILDIFDTYNFTIDEDDLYDSDIAIDPEMLWRIFEKMISISDKNIDEIVSIYESKKKIEIDKELNKKFGAFYTPREIVHYMTKESIVAYLINSLWGKKEEKEQKIRLLFEYKDKHLTWKDLRQTDFSKSFEELGDIIEDVDNSLRKMKILDPAVGSGAFPMWILHEVSTVRYYIYDVFYREFDLFETLQDYLVDGKVSMYLIKREIIQNNIFGVDIEPWAIDIARLRFWLSLVVDEEHPEPLPNFEFKFVCANTLIPLAESEKQTQLQFDDTKELNVETLRKYMVQYYNAQKNRDKTDMQSQLKSRIEKFLGIGKNISMDLYDTKSERTKQLETYHPFDKNHSASFFDPSLMMGNSKFDIVIWNPPYLRVQWIEKEISKAYKKLYKSSTGSYDLYVLFTEFALNAINKKWLVNYIMPHKWINSSFWKWLRGICLNKIDKFISFKEFSIFDASTYTSLIWLKYKSDKVKYYEAENNFNKNWELSMFLSSLNDSNSTDIDFKLLTDESWIFCNKETASIIEKLNLQEESIKTIFPKIFQWIATSKDSVYFLTSCKENNGIVEWFSQELNKKVSIERDLLKLLLKWDDVHRYENISTDKYVIFPYIDDWSTIRLYDENELVINFPNWYSYLKECESILRNREKWRLKDDDFWYRYIYPKSLWLFDKEKLLAPDISMWGNFAYDIKWEFAHTTTIYGYIKKESVVGDYKFYLAIFNSKLLWWYLVNTGTTLANWFFRYKPAYLDSFPLPKVKNLSEQEQIIKKTNEVLEIKKQPLYDPKNPPKEQLELEKEIDKMVYELYGLSEEEVRVVEESLK